MACALHDLGKGNESFQTLLQTGRGIQIIRHEHLSGLLLWFPPIQDWLKSTPHLEIYVTLSAVIGHHLRAGLQEFAEPLDPDLKRFKIFPEEILQILRQWESHWEMFPHLQAEMLPVWSFEAGYGFDLNPVKEGVKTALRRLKRRLREDEGLHRLLMAVRAALILADSAASAAPRIDQKIEHWLETAFRETLTGEFVETQIISPRVEQIKAQKRWRGWSDFQLSAEDLSARALLLAPCGSGKTLAAWRWIKGRLHVKPAARVIFLYPTRATATEGFRDYVSWAPEADVALIHGTAAYELEGMFDDPEDARFGKSFTTEDRLYALGFWHRRVFSATVDQFLGFMQQVYRSICLLPLLADSILVVDEVHSFDRKLFSAFKLFLKNFDLPVLCLTASLSPERKRALAEDCGLEIFPQDLGAFQDLEVQSARHRYDIQLLDDEDSAQEVALRSFQEGKRVLWVVNTVDRCQRLARSLSALCYHSRFRLVDRKKQHNLVISAFQNTTEPVLAITTQVCEMSLDLDAQVLISEYAPLTSLIQRLGRCNRRALQEGDPFGQVYFYPPEDDNPYTPDDLVGREEFLEAVAGREVSQLYLEQLLEAYGPAELELERYAAFLENGPWAKAREESLREAMDYTVDAVLDRDLETYLELRKQRQPTDALLLPVPRRWARPHPRLGRFPQVAPASHYHRDFGFFNFPLEEIL
ncbi:MAG: CRISPR-associated helicase Cas3' [Proteobacteria bacterium]|nr:CRISPR-associated helicase Cas3' [Pseudomonadota bacterium]MBU4449408.1 CRISPR-associated helicase Cas3' [Pseudomonadota bacterium]